MGQRWSATKGSQRTGRWGFFVNFCSCRFPFLVDCRRGESPFILPDVKDRIHAYSERAFISLPLTPSSAPLSQLVPLTCSEVMRRHRRHNRPRHSANRNLVRPLPIGSTSPSQATGGLLRPTFAPPHRPPRPLPLLHQRRARIQLRQQPVLVEDCSISIGIRDLPRRLQ